MSITDQFGKRILISDGAMGTMLLAAGLKAGELPELFNFTHPDIVEGIHRAYFEAGSDFVSANAFGANGPKMEGSGYSAQQAVTQAVYIAKKAAAEFENKSVALSVGSLGILMEPAGVFTFDKAYEIFKEMVVAGKKSGADFLLFETFTDIYEMKAAVTAAKENTGLPVVCSLTFEANGRMLMGADPLTAVNTIQDMGIAAIGVNCSLGPAQIAPIVKQILKYSKLPVLVQPNAGLPEITESGELVYKVTVEEYVDAVKEMIEAGVSIVGGCCGTSPVYIKALSESVKQIGDITWKRPETFVAASSGSKTVMEREAIASDAINITVNPELEKALQEDDMSYVRSRARKEGKSGATILNIRVDADGIDEEKAMLKVVKSVSAGTGTPLRLMSQKQEILDKIARECPGRPLLVKLP